MLNRRFAFFAFALALTACDPGGGTPTDSSTVRDSGRRDTNTRDTGGGGGCGDLGQGCCIGTTPCSVGTRCGSDRMCCATPGGASCSNPDDCCGDFDCVGGSCCSPEGNSCRTPNDCCSGLHCSPEGSCVRLPDDCGRAGQACCTGDEAPCGAGLTCAGDSCTACGAEGDLCCAPPAACQDDFVCSDGRCARPPSDCGNDGQACCTGNQCLGGLACQDGTCSAPSGDCEWRSCGDCTENYPPFCGWCADTNSCAAGDSSGPDTGSCGDWRYVPSACEADCTATDCGGCTGSTGCGWCGDTSSCEPGGSSGPTVGSCTDWTTVGVDCGGSTDTCPTNSDCGSCTSDFCGWCGDDSSCRRGGSTGPDSGSCANWAWFTSECSTGDPCFSATNCGDCTDRLECGWCAATGQCKVGDDTGPDVGTCGDWDYFSGDCADSCNTVLQTCSSFLDCCNDLNCRPRVSPGLLCCVDAGDSCGTSAECCGYMSCVGGTCECRAAGRGCLANNDCCSNVCTAGMCS